MKSRTSCVGCLLAVLAVLMGVMIFMVCGVMLETGTEYPPQIARLIEIADSVNDGYIEGVYDCDNMAIAFWEEATAEGYQVQIAVGNVHEDITSIYETDHSWCLVWIEDIPQMGEGWLAIEVTAAQPVFKEDNPRYYYGFFYDSPSELPWAPL